MGTHAIIVIADDEDEITFFRTPTATSCWTPATRCSDRCRATWRRSANGPGPGKYAATRAKARVGLAVLGTRYTFRDEPERTIATLAPTGLDLGGMRWQASVYEPVTLSAEPPRGEPLDLHGRPQDLAMATVGRPAHRRERRPPGDHPPLAREARGAQRDADADTYHHLIERLKADETECTQQLLLTI